MIPIGYLLISLIIPLVMAVGMTIFWLGLRGRVDLSSPACRRCRYDLRWVNVQEQHTCPECGSDIQHKGAVVFGRCSRSMTRLIIGVLVFLLPVSYGAYSMMAASRAMAANRAVAGGPAANKTTAALIADVQADANDPWAWRELEARLTAGTLTRDEASQAIEALIAHLQSLTASQPLHWSKEFLEQALTGNMLSEQQIDRLLRAHYDVDMQPMVRTTLRRGVANSFHLRGAAWDLPGYTTMIAIEDVTLDGPGEVKLQGRNASLTGTGRSGVRCDLVIDAAPGEYVVTFHTVIGVTGREMLFGPSTSRGGPLQADVAKWTRPITLKVRVLGEDESPVQLILGEDNAAKIRSSIDIRAVQLETEAGKMYSTVIMQVPQQMPVPVSFDVLIRYDDQERRLASFSVIDNSRSSSTSRTAIDDLSDELEFVDVILRPNIQHVERFTQAQAVWGEELVYEDVPLRR